MSFNIDSILGFAKSPVVARQGLDYQAVPQARQNIATDVHITTSRAQNDQSESHSFGDDDEAAPPMAKPVSLKDVSHLFLGRITGSLNIGMHVLFPYLASSPGRKFVTMSRS